MASSSDWRLLMLCSSIAAFPGSLLSLTYTFYIVERSSSNLLISLGIVLPMFFNSFSKLYGFLADYYNARKHFILIGWISSSLVLILPLIKPSLINVLLADILGMALWSIGSPALTAEIMECNKPGTRLGIWRSIDDAFYLLGTLSAGILYKILGLRIVLMLCLIIYLSMCMTIALFYKPIREGQQRKGSRLLHEFIEDLKISFLEKRGIMLNTAILILWFSIWSIEGLTRAKMMDVLNNEILYSLLTTLAIVVEMILAPFIGKFVDRYDPISGLIFGVLLHITTGSILALSNDPIILSLAWITPFGYLLSCSSYVAYGRLVGRLADAIGTYNTLTSIIALPASMAGSLADYIGRSKAILILTLISIPSLIVLYHIRKTSY